MRQTFRILLVLLLMGCCGFSQPPRLSPNARISVLTCGPGSDLYSAFGHSAFRVQDQEFGLDLVYNYGTFDFDAPNFYLNFARGRPVFSLSRQQFANFLYVYQLENRWVREQLLDLGMEEKNKVFQFLENNYRPANRHYRYDYIDENCSTKIPDVLQRVLGPDLVFKRDHLEEQLTFRELMQQYLHWNSWGSFGIDLGLGSPVDRVAQVRQMVFLPDYVMIQLENTLLGDKPLVERQRSILELKNGMLRPIFTASPLFWSLFLMVFTLTITYIDFRNQTRNRWLDFMLLLLTGSVGLVIAYLWFLSDHSAAAYNFNILWAVPTNVIVALFVIRNGPLQRWIPGYFKVVLSLLPVAAFLWLFKVQDFSPIVAVLLLTALIRYAYINYYFKKFYPIWVEQLWKKK